MGKDDQPDQEKRKEWWDQFNERFVECVTCGIVMQKGLAKRVWHLYAGSEPKGIPYCAACKPDYDTVDHTKEAIYYSSAPLASGTFNKATGIRYLKNVEIEPDSASQP
jgi:hypothetical protein